MKFDLTRLRHINILVATGISSAYLLGKSVSVNNAKKKLELTKDDRVVVVPPKLQSLIDEVTQDMKLDMKKFQVIPFMATGSDVQQISFPLFKEIYIGVPEYFILDKDDNSTFTVKVGKSETSLNESELTSLKKAMSLSKEAKKFGIAQKIYESQYSIILPSGILPMFIVLNCSFMSYLLERNEKASKKFSHVSNHFMIFLIGAWMYALLFDVLSIFKEAESDFRVAALGKSYIEGGIEYYQKMIKKNKFFKKLSKDAPYTEEGDINTTKFRTNHMPLDKRITYLTQLSKGEKESIWNYILF